MLDDFCINKKAPWGCYAQFTLGGLRQTGSIFRAIAIEEIKSILLTRYAVTFYNCKSESLFWRA